MTENFFKDDEHKSVNRPFIPGSSYYILHLKISKLLHSICILKIRCAVSDLVNHLQPPPLIQNKEDNKNERRK